MKIAIYSRKSKFTGKGDSVENQISICKEYARTHFNSNNVTIYEDEGFSGGNIDRPQFKTLTKDIQKNKFDVLICYRLDRISRNVSDFSTTLELLNKHNVAFVSVREQFDTSTPMGRAMMYISSVFAQLERETIAERIRDNMMQLARSGRWLGGTYPTGFTSESITFIDENMKERKLYKLIPIDEELETVRTIFKKYLELQSLQQLESYCLVNNIKTRNGNDFHKVTLRQILFNPVYAKADPDIYEYFKGQGADICNPEKDFNGKFGMTGYNKRHLTNTRMSRYNDKSDWIVAIGRHKGIIEGKDWVKVQHISASNRHLAPRAGTSASALLSGLMRCSCGSFMKVQYGPFKPNSEERYHYYACNMSVITKKQRCDAKRAQGKKADEIVIDTLKNRLVPMIQKEIDKMKKETNTTTSNLKVLKDKIAKNKKSIENLVKQIAGKEDSFAAEYLMNEIERLGKETKELEIKFETEGDASEVKNVNLDILKESAIEFTAKIDTADFDERRRLVKSLVDYIEWDGVNLHIKTFNL